MSVRSDPESTEFWNNVKLYSKDLKFIELRSYCLKKENLYEVVENGWDLIIFLMNLLKEEKIDKSNFKHFEAIFLYITTVSKSKEIFLSLLEQFDPMIESDLVVLLFSSLTKCCSNLIKDDMPNLSSNFEMLFSTLSYYIESLNLPNYTEFEPEKNEELVEEKIISKFLVICVQFVETVFFDIPIDFKDNFCVSVKDKENLNCTKKEMFKFCCFLLERLSYLDLDENSKVLSCTSTNNSGGGLRNSIQLAYSICNLIRKLKSPHEMFQSLLWCNTSNQENITTEEYKQYILARGVFLYLNLTKLGLAFYFPQVLHAQYVFIFSIPSILGLWETGNPVHIHKGLELARFTGNRVEPLTLHLSYVDQCTKLSSVQYCSRKILESAIYIAVQSPILILRQRALQFIKHYLDKFEWPDRHYLLLNLLKGDYHSGIIGYLIGYLKDKLIEALASLSQNSSKASFFMLNLNLEKCFDLCFDLPDGSETDILSKYDKIISSLNLLRFILIKNIFNKVGILPYLEKVMQNFVNPLRTGINLSQMHFSDELKKLNDPKSATNFESSLSLNGVNLPSLSYQDRKQTLVSAINSFDILQSLCIRVEELAEETHLL